jgi:hypothetical protein
MKDSAKVCLSLVAIATLLVYSMFVTSKLNAEPAYVGVSKNIIIEETGLHDGQRYTVFSDRKTGARIFYYFHGAVLLPKTFQ